MSRRPSNPSTVTQQATFEAMGMGKIAALVVSYGQRSPTDNRTFSRRRLIVSMLRMRS